MDSRVFVTGMLFLTSLCVGIIEGIIGPTLIDLKDHLHTSYEPVSIAIMLRSVTFMASGYVMGACYEYQRRYVNIYMMFCCLLGVIASLSIPWCTTVIQLALCYLGIGYTGGSLHAGVYLLTLGLWGKDAIIPFHTIAGGVTLGRAIPSLYSAPFLTTTQLNTSIPNTTYRGQYLLYVPYTINGSFLLSAMAGFLLMTIIYGTNNIYCENSNKMISSEEKPPWFFYMAVFTLNLFLSSRVFVMVNFLVSMTVESDIQLSKQCANILTFTLLASDACSRFGSGIISKAIALEWIVLVQITVGTFLCVMLAVFGLTSVIVLWIFTPLHNIFLGGLRSTLLSLINSRLVLTGFLMATADAGLASGKLSSSWIGGAVLDKSRPQILLYIWLGLQISVAVLGYIMVAFLWGKTIRFQTLANDESKPDTKALLENEELK